MNEDTLILYYYKDGLTDAERRKVEAAINGDPAVAARYDALCRELNDLSEPDVPAVPTHTVERWHTAIDDAARQSTARARPQRRIFSPMSFAWGAALAAAIVVGVTMNMQTAEQVVVEPATTSAAFTRGVQVHFRDTYADLNSLPVDSADERTALLMHMIDQNRLFERAAEQNDSQDLARVLRAFEPILIRLAADDITPEEAESLRAKLALELNVMLTKLSRDTSNEADTSTTGIQT